MRKNSRVTAPTAVTFERKGSSHNVSHDFVNTLFEPTHVFQADILNS